MPLFDDVRTLLQRLASRGWDALLEKHGLHLDAADLETELQRTLADAGGHSSIDRTQEGFEDFSTAGCKAITPGNPALSLLYHALASPAVAGKAGGKAADFATLEELDTLENYIFSVARKKLSDFDDPVIAVFAYQYRPGMRSVHRVHADMAYSRTGIARVGTAVPNYDPARRSFWVAPKNGAAGIAVMPARYAAFIAERRRLTAKDAVMHPLDDPLDGDGARMFLVPVHKLFAGNECLVGESVPELKFHEYHRSEKLRKIHQLAVAKGGVAPQPGFDIDQAPFVRDSKALVALQSTGASVLLTPVVKPTLVETAKQHNSASGASETVRFRVPKANHLFGRGNRFETSSFQIPVPPNLDVRAAPEYAHMRLHVRPNGAFFDLNGLKGDFAKVLSSAALKDVDGVEDGPLEAAHFLDGTCDGALAVAVALSQALPHYAALSLVAAPDFLPLVDQLEVQRWAERRGLNDDNYFAQGAPAPLCYGRGVGQNPALVDPVSASGHAFDRHDAANNTVTAVLSAAAQPSGKRHALGPSVATGWLPDSAADVFEPGWDTAKFKDGDGDFYVNYGLGSPFPEDAKLCAALNSFWPAAAPDVGRTFGRMTALPLLDDELGLHPKHPRVLAGDAVSAPGWDGEFGPFFVDGGARVNISNMARSDYTLAALHGKLGVGALDRIDAVELLARMDAFRECADRIRGTTPMADFDGLLVRAEKVTDWSQEADRFDASLHGPGYRYVFAQIQQPADDPNDRRRQLAAVDATFVCQVSADKVGMRRDQGTAKVTGWLHQIPADT